MKNRRIVLVVSGGIAAYKAVDLASRLRKAGAEVRVAMTASAAQFVGPLSFEAVTGHSVYQSVLGAPDSYAMEHISWARWAEAVVVAPATANFIAKLAHGMADDAPSTLLLAFRGPVWVAPAMNTAMWEHAATRENVETIFSRGVHVIDPEAGALACGEHGEGRMAEPEAIMQRLADEMPHAAQLVRIDEDRNDEDARVLPVGGVAAEKSSAAQGNNGGGNGAAARPLAGKTVLVTTGPTREMLDPIRYISNASSGRMGLEIAVEAHRRGARVILIHGPMALPIPVGIETREIASARELLAAVQRVWDEIDVAVFAAAVANYESEAAAGNKIKGGKKLELTLTRTPDVAGWCGEHRREGQLLIGFCAESENLLETAGKKLRDKKLDLICANPIGEPGIGFAAQDNRITLLDAAGRQTPSPRVSKAKLAGWLWDRV